jgi:hypothetical protein
VLALVILIGSVGDLASTFPITATVESDFSVIEWMKNKFRTCLTDFSGEGILHCKQFGTLNNLKASVCYDAKLCLLYPLRASPLVNV